MMILELDDRAEIEGYARANPGLHIYELGDLDPFFWPHTRWFGVRGEDGALAALALLYTGARVPTLLALAGSSAEAELVEALASRLPERLYAHLGPAVVDGLRARFGCTHHGRHLKFVLREPRRLADAWTEGVAALGPAELDELLELYARSYPGNWFDARMLETGQYLGVRRDGELVCVAGVHVYSPRYSVAALGNVTTDPAWRGQGLARGTVAALCRQLGQSCATIGLNVHADNAAAIACYRGLGFGEIASYDEYMLEASG